MRVLGDTDEPVDIMLAPAKSQVIFKVDTTEVVSRLIDGQFPNYQSVLPTSHSTRALVDRDDLLKAVRLTALIASSSANVVRLGFGEEDNPATIAVNAKADVGDAEGGWRRSWRATRSPSPSTRATWWRPCRTWTASSSRSS